MNNGYTWKPSNLEDKWKEWLSPLRFLEPSLIMTYAGSDVSRRADQLFDNIEFIISELGVNDVEIITLDYRTDKWKNVSELNAILLKFKSDSTKLIWIYGFEEILRDGRRDLIIEIQNIYRDADKRLVLVCEANYYDIEFEKLLLSLPSFDPRISLHGNYEKEQLSEFVSYLANKWNIQIVQQTIQLIIEKVGSNLRLIKSIMWYLRDKGVSKLPEALTSQQILWQVRSIWQKLSDNERKIILSHEYGFSIEEDLSMSREYVEIMGILNSPLLSKFVRKYVGNPHDLRIDKDMLLIGGKDYSNYFTEKQKDILKILLSHPGEYVTREEIIEIVWKNDDENGSDWALDSQVNRLRQRLDEVGIGKNYLCTKRGRGLLWLQQ